MTLILPLPNAIWRNDGETTETPCLCNCRWNSNAIRHRRATSWRLRWRWRWLHLLRNSCCLEFFQPTFALLNSENFRNALPGRYGRSSSLPVSGTLPLPESAIPLKYIVRLAVPVSTTRPMQPSLHPHVAHCGNDLFQRGHSVAPCNSGIWDRNELVVSLTPRPASAQQQFRSLPKNPRDPTRPTRLSNCRLSLRGHLASHSPLLQRPT